MLAVTLLYSVSLLLIRKGHPDALHAIKISQQCTWLSGLVLAFSECQVTFYQKFFSVPVILW
uniref:Very-long-chain 3-oxoacyl-CoA synthase n=1 Tax=Octopus bimaculoides TaxID=37653 RepID=A0A0L8HFD4_OCTBM